MANTRITNLSEDTAPADGDFVATVDVSDTTQSAQGSTKKVQAQNLVVKKVRETGGPTVLTVGAVADGEFLKRDGSSIVSAAAGGGGGLGDVVGPASAVDERVAVFDGTTGRLIKDGGSTIADIIAAGGGGGALAEFLPITQPPALTNWTWVNQGTAQANDRGSGTSTGVVLRDATHSGNNVAMLVRAAPGSTPYQVTAGVILNGIHRNFCSLGVLHRSSGDGKLTCLGMLSSTTSNLRVYTHTGPTSSGSVKTSIHPEAQSFAGAPIIYLRMRDDGTNRIYSYSTNGHDFIQLYSVARTTDHTPDEVGFFVDANGTTLDIALALVSWLVENV